MGDRRTLRRRWIAAGVVSLAAHGLVFLGLSLTPRDGPPAPPLPVFISLERPEPPKLRPSPARTPTHAPAQAIQMHQPANPPAAVPTSGFAPGAASPPTPTAPVPAPPQQASAVPHLKLDCLNLGPTARTSASGSEDCQVRKYRKLAESDGGYDVPDNPAWDAAIARKQAVHRPLPPEKPFRNDCAGSNLGLGCVDDALVLSTKRKF